MATLQGVRRGTGEVRHSGYGGFVRHVVIFVFLFWNIYPSDFLLLKRTNRGKLSCPYVTAYHYSIFILQLFILAPVRVFCVRLNVCYLALNNVPPNNFYFVDYCSVVLEQDLELDHACSEQFFCVWSPIPYHLTLVLLFTDAKICALVANFSLAGFVQYWQRWLTHCFSCRIPCTMSCVTRGNIKACTVLAEKQCH